MLVTIAKAQSHTALPWQNLTLLPWQITYSNTAKDYAKIRPQQLDYSLTLQLEPSGIAQVTDKQGFIRVRLELPGRPRKAWRDWGIPINNLLAPSQFPEEVPLQQDVISILMQITDFRLNLEGLIWVIDDSEKILTIINPANSSVSYILLPGGSDIDLVFHPDHLEVIGEVVDIAKKTKISWTLNWLALLPTLMQPNIKKSNNNIYSIPLTFFPKTQKTQIF